jgi:hypothetical protein
MSVAWYTSGRPGTACPLLRLCHSCGGRNPDTVGAALCPIREHLRVSDVGWTPASAGVTENACSAGRCKKAQGPDTPPGQGMLAGKWRGEQVGPLREGPAFWYHGCIACRGAPLHDARSELVARITVGPVEAATGEDDVRPTTCG